MSFPAVNSQGWFPTEVTPIVSHTDTLNQADILVESHYDKLRIVDANALHHVPTHCSRPTNTDNRRTMYCSFRALSRYTRLEIFSIFGTAIFLIVWERFSQFLQKKNFLIFVTKTSRIFGTSIFAWQSFHRFPRFLGQHFSDFCTSNFPDLGNKNFSNNCESNFSSDFCVAAIFPIFVNLIKFSQFFPRKIPDFWRKNFLNLCESNFTDFWDCKFFPIFLNQIFSIFSKKLRFFKRKFPQFMLKQFSWFRQKFCYRFLRWPISQFL